MNMFNMHVTRAMLKTDAFQTKLHQLNQFFPNNLLSSSNLFISSQGCSGLEQSTNVPIIFGW